MNIYIKQIKELFQKHSNKIYIVYDNKSYTFEYIYNQANIISDNLIHNYKIKAKDIIILKFANSIDFIINYWAILIAGGIVISLYNELTEYETEQIAIHSKAKLKIEKTGINIYENNINNDNNILPDDLAVIIYTSGTTGESKGVMLSYKNIFAEIKSSSKAINLKNTDNYLGVLSLAHVFGQMNIMWSALFEGISIYLMPKFQANEMIEYIKKYKPSIIIAVPTMYQSMLNQWKLKEEKAIIENLRLLHTGATPLPISLKHNLENFFNVPVQEGYGLTETCSMAFSNPMHDIRDASVGLPIEGIKYKLIDENNNIIENINTIGQICISGDIITSGYLFNTDITNKTIIDNYLYTGDLGYKDKDNYLYIVDRIKDMIIKGGYKIYTREIEEILLLNIEHILQIAVIGKGERLIAYIIPKTKLNNEEENILIEKCKIIANEKLAKYKRPNKYIITDYIPQTPSGKLKKRLLLEIDN